jgi:hypothetical protein
MLLGAHLTNLTEPTEADWRQLERIKPACVVTMAGGHYHGRHVYDRLEAISRPTYLVRVGSGVQDIAGVKADLDRAVSLVPGHVLTQGRAYFRIGNEPNHEGWPVEDYRDVLYQAAAYAHSLGMSVMAANLCLQPGWQQYLHAIAPAVECCDAIGLSLYHDDASDPSRWLEDYRRFGLPLWGVEWGTPAYHGADRVQWHRWTAGILEPHVKGLCVYIVGGSDDWAGGETPYRLRDDEAEGYADVVAEFDRPFAEATR